VTESDLACLKSNIGKFVEIETTDGVRHLVKVLSVFDGEDDPDVFYELVFTSHPYLYPRMADKSIGYSLPLANIVSVKAATGA